MACVGVGRSVLDVWLCGCIHCRCIVLVVLSASVGDFDSKSGQGAEEVVLVDP